MWHIPSISLDLAGTLFYSLSANLLDCIWQYIHGTHSPTFTITQVCKFCNLFAWYGGFSVVLGYLKLCFESAEISRWYSPYRQYLYYAEIQSKVNRIVKQEYQWIIQLASISSVSPHLHSVRIYTSPTGLISVNFINYILTTSKYLCQIPACIYMIAAGSLEQVKQSPIVLPSAECEVDFQLLCFINCYRVWSSG